MKTCTSTPSPRMFPGSGSPVWSVAATFRSLRRNDLVGALLISTLDVGRSPSDGFLMFHDKLFIPGPVEISAKTWAAFSRPMIGHRSEQFRDLYRSIHPRLQ